MTPDPRTEEIRERVAAATPGPWITGDRDPDDVQKVFRLRLSGESLITARTIADEIDRDVDAALIANAPADLAYLLARIEALEADSDRTHRKIRDLTDIAVEATVEYHRLRAVADAARAILHDFRAGEQTPPADVDALESALDALDGGQ